jgi:aspartyl-tRNA(Asn)/glutamyl-tRNA(Gln) amidotransferase subunit C
MIRDKDLKKICELAKIEIDDRCKDEFLRKLNSVFDWIDQLREIDVSSVDNISGDNSNSLGKTPDQLNFLERQDEPSLTSSRELLMKNAKLQKFGMFCVPKVVD